MRCSKSNRHHATPFTFSRTPMRKQPLCRSYIEGVAMIWKLYHAQSALCRNWTLATSTSRSQLLHATKPRRSASIEADEDIIAASHFEKLTAQPHVIAHHRIHITPTRCNKNSRAYSSALLPAFRGASHRFRTLSPLSVTSRHYGRTPIISPYPAYIVNMHRRHRLLDHFDCWIDDRLR